MSKKHVDAYAMIAPGRCVISVDRPDHPCSTNKVLKLEVLDSDAPGQPRVLDEPVPVFELRSDTRAPR